MTRRRISSLFCTLICVLASSRLLVAQDKVYAPAPFKRGVWIRPADGPQRDTGIYHFRRTLPLHDVPRVLKVRVSADSRFILYVNGARVGEGPARADLAHWRYETFDLAPYLVTGDNVVAAVVWNLGVLAPVSQISSRTAFLLEAEDESYRALDTNESWTTAPASGRSPIEFAYGKYLKGYFAAPPGERLDGTQHDWQWNLPTQGPGNAGKEWKPAAIFARASLRGEQDAPAIWMLQPDPLPPMEYSDASIGKIVRMDGVPAVTAGTPIRVAAHSQATILFDTGTLTTAYPEIVLSGGRGARVKVTYAEALVDDQGNKGNRGEIAGRHIRGLWDEFVADGGKDRAFVPLDWRAWRFLQVEIATDAEPVQLNRVAMKFTAYPFHELGSFHSSDPTLSDIWNVGWRTARLDAHETYMDTPYWERLQYVGDTRLQALISYGVSGDDRLARQAIDAIDASRLTDGLTQSRYPAALPQMIPPFSLLWVGMVHDFWMYRDDPEFVRSHLPGVRAVLGWFMTHQRPDGLLDRMPWWNFLDWTADFQDGVPPQDKDGGSVPLTLQLVEALRYAAELEREVGDPDRAPSYERAAARAIQTIRSECWNDAAGLVADTPARTHYSEETNALAVWLHAVPADREKAVMERLLQGEKTGPVGAPAHLSPSSYYFRFYTARALESSGLGDRYLATLQPWRDMLALGLTTWAEQPEPTRSDSHAWSSHPNFDFLRIVAGIRPAKAGFASVAIEPHPGQLRNFEAVYPHPRGRIAVSYRTLPQGIRVTIDLPEGLPGTFSWKGRTYPLHAGEQVIEGP